MRKNSSRNAARIMALVLAALLVFSALISAIYMIASAESESGADAPERTRYEISACMRPDLQAIGCEQTTVYRNETDGKLSQLFFACYCNAFRRQSLAPFDADDWGAAYPEGFAPGGIQFASVAVNGETADWGVQGENEVFLRVEVDLDAGESCEVVFAYDLLLPVTTGFLGAGSFDWRLTNAFPTVCAYRDGGFCLNDALSVGDFAYADAADWSISLTAPDGWECVTSGVEACESAGDGWTRWTSTVRNARDMAVVLGRRYTAYGRASANGRAITVYCNDYSAGQAVLEAADRALTLFEGWFGKYRYADLDIVMSQYCMGVKSAPGVILLDRDLFSFGSRADLEYAVAFGVAKQYFGQIVGNDPYDEAWLSEAVGAYCALLYYRETFGEERFLREMNDRVKPSLQLTIPGGVAPDSPSIYFNSRREFDMCVRGRGAAVLYELHGAMGEDAFFEALATYVSDNAFGYATAREFAAACNSTGGEWDLFLVDTLRTIGEYTDQRLDWYE